MIRERGTDAVIDAAFDIPGWPLTDMQITQSTLAWSTAGLGGQTTVTVGFTFANWTDVVHAFLISMPAGFQQKVRGVEDVKSSNSMLPLMKGGQDWIDSSSPERLRILLEQDDLMIAIGSYRLSFPVTLPQVSTSMPTLNLWRLSLCTDRSCIQPEDSSVLVSFPMAGFAPGEISLLEQKRIQAAVGLETDSAFSVQGGLPALWLALMTECFFVTLERMWR